jgi:hypothetical protein
MNRPIPESYWVEPERLLAGEYPAHFNVDFTRHRIDKLIEAGFDMFIDLTRPNETIPYLPILEEEAKLYNVEVEHHRFPIGDHRYRQADRSTSTAGAGSGEPAQR